MKKLCFAALLALVCSSPLAHADDIYFPVAHATIVPAAQIGLPPKIAVGFKPASAGTVQVFATGLNVDSDARLQKLAKLQSASYALQKGYDYFTLEITKKALGCRSTMFSATWGIIPRLEGSLTLSKAPKAGALNAKAILAKYSAELSTDAPKAEKDAAFAGWRDACYSKYSPTSIRNEIAGQKMVNGIVSALLH